MVDIEAKVTDKSDLGFWGEIEVPVNYFGDGFSDEDFTKTAVLRFRILPFNGEARGCKVNTGLVDENGQPILRDFSGGVGLTFEARQEFGQRLEELVRGRHFQERLLQIARQSTE